MRRSGRTTRAINKAIEALFQDHEITIIDHHGTGAATRYMASIMIERLYKEHHLKRENLTIKEDEYSINIKLNSPGQAS